MPMLGETGYTTAPVLVDLTTVGDTFVYVPFNNFIVRRFTLYKPSGTMATSAATIGAYTAAAAGGSLISTVATATGLTATRKFLDRTIASPATVDILAPTQYTNPINGQTQSGIFVRVGVVDDGSVTSVMAVFDLEAIVPAVV
jgi:hypothetical protein